MPNQSGDSTSGSCTLEYNIATILEVDSSRLAHDKKYLYASCSDMKVRVWSKEDWQLVAELGETSTEPLGVDVDADQVYATCAQRVYVWKKDTWGMMGWFELSYEALTSDLLGDRLYVGAKEGRLLQIKKDTHETSSWQLHKSDIISIWSSGNIICTCSKKEEPTIWQHEQNKAPTEVTRLDKKGRNGFLWGNQEFVFAGANTGEVEAWDRVEWQHVQDLQSRQSSPTISMWANDLFLINGLSTGKVIVWDLDQWTEICEINTNGVRPEWIIGDQNRIYVATAEGILIIELSIGEEPFNLNSVGAHRPIQSLLRTSPYDVLEAALKSQGKGDTLLQEGKHHDAVVEYENALQLLIDNTHALLEVPKERQKLTEEINSRLGRALIRAKIEDIQGLNKEIEQVSDELELRGRTSLADEEVEDLWNRATRIVRESRALAEAHTSNILSFKLTYVADTIEADLEAAKLKLDQYREKVNQALALTHLILSEWRLIERRRTGLLERKEYLETAIKRIEERLKAAEGDPDVTQILSSALTEYQQLHEKISKILAAADQEPDEEFSSREEAIEAIHGLLMVMPKKRTAMLAIEDISERESERERLISAIQQALETATRFKMKEEIRNLNNELNSITDSSKTHDEKQD